MTARVLLKHDPWLIIESPYQPEYNIYFETNFTQGNGYMGVRGLPEEGFAEEMETYPGMYIAGVFDEFDDGLVELVNIPDYFALTIRIGGDTPAMTPESVSEYERTLDMRDGTLTRSFVYTDGQGQATRCMFQRFLSLPRQHLACQRVCATPLNHAQPIEMEMALDGGAFNRRQRDYPPLKRVVPNYHLDMIANTHARATASLQLRTKSTGIGLCEAVRLAPIGTPEVASELCGQRVVQRLRFAPACGETVGFDKYIAVYTSREVEASAVAEQATAEAARAEATGYEALLQEQQAAWRQRWEDADIVIGGDLSAQQGIRFNIFNLIQANARRDAGVSLAAKLLSHTRYKGNAFWDTEIFMLPFFLYTDPEAARNLLLYRYHMLPGARGKAARLGMRGAMYPWMSAHDGSEQCDSWEYGDCEIHITADIVYAIEQYLQATADEAFFADHAAEIYIETARFWAERVAWNPQRKAYTIITVKGPDEYCAITNNNMYTNYLAAYNLELAERAVAAMRERYPRQWARLITLLDFDEAEVAQWRKIREGMYYHWRRGGRLLMQDDTFLDKPKFDLTPYAMRDKPVLEIIGYERAMRVRILRQTDVILLMYLLNDRFTRAEKQAAYHYYEPITTHDSSLSYNTHCIMAAELGMLGRAFNYFTKTCRLDLDDELDTARSGLHGASLGGTWQSLVNGFGGLRLKDGQLALAPKLPGRWSSLAFRLHFQGRKIAVTVTKKGTELTLLAGEPLSVLLHGEEVRLEGVAVGA